jgi:phage tail sheath protein FI
MPATLTYPGVYIEELSSGVHTITGVATSIAAFVGWANQGPIDEAVLVESWSDFQTQFGGFTNTTGIPNYLGYAVNQFFGNGGQQAYIIRLAWNPGPTTYPTTGANSGLLPCATANSAASSPPDSAGICNATLYAANPGLWGNSLVVQVTVPPTSPPASRFSVQVQLVAPNGTVQVLENFANLSASPIDPLYVVTVLNNDSQYVTFINPNNPTAAITLSGAPVSDSITFSGGADGATLVPADGNFEIALGPDTSPTSTNHFGLRLLDLVDIFNLLCVPGETDAATVSALQHYCTNVRAFYIVDCPQTATTAGLNGTGPVGTSDTGGLLTGQYSPNSAFYYPWILAPDPLVGNRPTLFPPCGFVAGIYAGTDASRGVWKAPAGIDASLTGVAGLQYNLTDLENGDLNIQAINCFRQFRVYGDVVWGARTLQGNDQAGSQWKYVPIRRLALFLESSLYDGTQWVVFEPNDETLWGQIRLNVGSFMQGLFLQGAFQGSTPQLAYFVKCDSENNPQSSIDQGIVNILVGFAPLYPAEFVVIQIQQMAGQTQS